MRRLKPGTLQKNITTKPFKSLYRIVPADPVNYRVDMVNDLAVIKFHINRIKAKCFSPLHKGYDPCRMD